MTCAECHWSESVCGYMLCRFHRTVMLPDGTCGSFLKEDD